MVNQRRVTSSRRGRGGRTVTSTVRGRGVGRTRTPRSVAVHKKINERFHQIAATAVSGTSRRGGRGGRGSRGGRGGAANKPVRTVTVRGRNQSRGGNRSGRGGNRGGGRGGRGGRRGNGVPKADRLDAELDTYWYKGGKGPDPKQKKLDREMDSYWKNKDDKGMEEDNNANTNNAAGGNTTA